MDGNDRLGDCTIAALAHAVTTFRGLLDARRIMPEAAVVALYEKLTGGRDTGFNELDVLNYWRQHAAAGDEVQQDCIQDFDAGRPWTPGPLTADGHAVFAVAYDARGASCSPGAARSAGRGHGGTRPWTRRTRSCRRRREMSGSRPASTSRSSRKIWRR